MQSSCHCNMKYLLNLAVTILFNKLLKLKLGRKILRVQKCANNI